jgi:hypothetical protein
MHATRLGLLCRSTYTLTMLFDHLRFSFSSGGTNCYLQIHTRDTRFLSAISSERLFSSSMAISCSSGSCLWIVRVIHSVGLENLKSPSALLNLVLQFQKAFLVFATRRHIYRLFDGVGRHRSVLRIDLCIVNDVMTRQGVEFITEHDRPAQCPL